MLELIQATGTQDAVQPNSYITIDIGNIFPKARKDIFMS